MSAKFTLPTFNHNELIAAGIDVTPLNLINSYYNGIFPWFNEGEVTKWWSPYIRAVWQKNDLHISKSLAKFIHKNTFTVTINTDFRSVINACADMRSNSGTWITKPMITAYTKLHESQIAHSIEVWNEDNLVGGLYGISVGAVFCGESMFHTQTNASKIAVYALHKQLFNAKFALIDAQMINDHLLTLGVKAMPRSEYLKILVKNRDIKIDMDYLKPQIINLI